MRMVKNGRESLAAVACVCVCVYVCVWRICQAMVYGMNMYSRRTEVGESSVMSDPSALCYCPFFPLEAWVLIGQTRIDESKHGGKREGGCQVKRQRHL
ncbi:hypothetical protein CEXT_36111 [Caerostris extrusa]|uniref:Secreted protein n=1 Tax=Caerostris extrusa TaxID=172846 RepID=A0AAV4MEE2_CAEEX|nr:hypothetical protein CEXT_36111 [Caerostris extrusa]